MGWVTMSERDLSSVCRLLLRHYLSYAEALDELAFQPSSVLKTSLLDEDRNSTNSQLGGDEPVFALFPHPVSLASCLPRD
jgi:hypothetical protein